VAVQLRVAVPGEPRVRARVQLPVAMVGLPVDPLVPARAQLPVAMVGLPLVPARAQLLVAKLSG
jgi:hypothetical protein